MLVFVPDAARNEKLLQEELKDTKGAIKVLKESTKAVAESEYYLSRKLAYEKGIRKDLDIDLVSAMKTIQNDQVAIARLEAKVTDLEEAAGYVMDMVVSQEDKDEPVPLLDRLIVAPDHLKSLLKDAGKTVAVGALTWVKSHFPEVNMKKVEAGENKDADLEAIEAEVQVVADKVVERFEL